MTDTRTTGRSSDQFLSFSARDSGIGVSSALLPRLFDSFAQEDETSSPRIR